MFLPERMIDLQNARKIYEQGIRCKRSAVWCANSIWNRTHLKRWNPKQAIWNLFIAILSFRTLWLREKSDSGDIKGHKPSVQVEFLKQKGQKGTPYHAQFYSQNSMRLLYQTLCMCIQRKNRCYHLVMTSLKAFAKSINIMVLPLSISFRFDLADPTGTKALYWPQSMFLPTDKIRNSQKGAVQPHSFKKLF